MPIPSMQFSTPTVKKKDDGGGALGVIGKALKVASPFAALIPGVGTLAAAGMAVGGTLLGSVLEGASASSAAADAVTSGAGAIGNALGLPKREETPSEARMAGRGQAALSIGTQPVGAPGIPFIPSMQYRFPTPSLYTGQGY